VADDAVATGNEAVAGARLYTSCTLGYDTANYVVIPTSYGDQSDQFISSVDSAAHAWAQRVFWDFPYFWTNKRTRDFPTGVSPSGLVRLFCTGVEWDGTNTKVWYSDSITSAADVWVTGCSLDGTKGTANFTAGRRSSTQGESAVSLGWNTRSWSPFAASFNQSTEATGQGAFSTGIQSVASGQGSFTQGYKTTASGEYSTAFGYQTTASGQGATTFGINTVADNNYYVNYNSQANFAEAGDIQGGFYTSKALSTTATPVISILMYVPFESAVTCESKIVAVQTAGSAGTIGETRHYNYSWGVYVGTMYVMDSVNLAADTIFFTGDDLAVDTKLGFNTYEDSTLVDQTEVPGGLTYNTSFYVVTSGTGWIQVSTSIGGAVRDITSFDDTDYHTFAHNEVLPESAPNLIGSTFADDGDVVGDGVTTGIRPLVFGALNRYRLQMYFYGLTNRTVRWGTSNNYVIVKH